MKIAIIGANGQLGSDIARLLFDRDPILLTHQEIEIADPESVKTVLIACKPDLVINTAAFTNVDKCESEDIRAFKVNALGARHLAETCESLGAVLLHISTDYVFDGTKGTPYVEEDSTGPVNVYGLTKLSGEHYVRYLSSRHYIVRTSGLYGLSICRGKGGNFVEKMLKLSRERDVIRVVSDETLTPTFTEDLSRQVVLIAERSLPYGVYHATNGGECSWFEFAEELFNLSCAKVRLEKTTAKEWKAPARRPAYSVLENASLKKQACDVLPHWRDALKRYLQKRGY